MRRRPGHPGLPAAPSSTPLSSSSNAGAESFAASSMVRYCASANRSRIGPRTASPPAASTRHRRLLDVRRLLVADLVERQAERDEPLADLQRADRVQHEQVGVAELAQADEQPARRPGPSPASCRASRARRAAPAAPGIGGSTSARRSPNVWSMSTEMSKKSSEIVAEPVMCHGVGPSSEPRSWIAPDADPEHLDARSRRDLDDQVERREAQQRVEAEVALDAERARIRRTPRRARRAARCWS